LIFAIDYMAIRHIFYYLKGGHIWWSTDLAPLVLLSGEKLNIDDNYIAGYLAHNPEAHLTPYLEIREVPPGKFVRIRHGRAHVEPYWRFSPQSRIRYKTDAGYEEHFRFVLRQSVRRRLSSDCPILAELSGGLDSSSIVCVADDIIARESAGAPRLDTLSFYDDTEPNGDDSIYLRKVEEQRGKVGIHIDASKIETSPSSLAVAEFCAMPGALGFAEHLGAEQAEHVRNGRYRVLLSGIGGDEFLGGVPDPRGQLADLLVQCRFVSLARQLMAWSLVKRRPWIHLLWQTTIEALPATLGQYIAEEARIESWIRKDFAKRKRLAFKHLDVVEHFGLWLPSRCAYIGGVQLMANNLAKFTPPALVEARYPYLDQNLIEFILSIPATQLLRPGERRSLMRRSLIGIVPQEILSRRTKQLGARTPALLLEKHWDELQSIYQMPLSARFGYVDKTQLVNTICHARAGRIVPLARLLWTISLEYWLRDLVRRDLLEAPSVSLLPLRTRGVAASA
jgi:asparagine synthase (glutamine-hydrolysing)